jgi:hypothetical protein
VLIIPGMALAKPAHAEYASSGPAANAMLTIADTQGNPVQGAAILAETTMLDMDMGNDVLQLQADSSSPGTFSGQSDLTMAGHWRVRLRILLPNEKTCVIVVFSFVTR